MVVVVVGGVPWPPPPRVPLGGGPEPGVSTCHTPFTCLRNPARMWVQISAAELG